MKHIVSLLVLVMLIYTSADAQKKRFLRFYDFSGHKFERGRVERTTDSSIFVLRDALLIEIPVSKISFIKTKRSYGQNALLSSLALAATGGIIGYAVGKPKSDVKYTYDLGDYESRDFTTFTGVVLGGLSGVLAGALISAGSQTFVINGDQEIWKRINKQITAKRKSGS